MHPCQKKTRKMYGACKRNLYIHCEATLNTLKPKKGVNMLEQEDMYNGTTINSRVQLDESEGEEREVKKSRIKC